MGSMKDLLSDVPYETAFGGVTYVPSRDHARLSGQVLRTFNALADGQWRTLPQLAQIVGCTTQSVSARIRDLKKAKFGSHNIIKEHLGNGLWQYRMVS